MEELFFIRDYDDETILEIYITNNSARCYEILQNIDMNKDNEYYLSRFEKECEKEGIKFSRVERFTTYYY